MGGVPAPPDPLIPVPTDCRRTDGLGNFFGYFAAAKLTPVVFPTLLRVNLPAVVGLLALQLKSGRKGFLPLEVQAVLASLYTAVALGVTKLPRPTGDRFPDVSAPNEGE